MMKSELKSRVTYFVIFCSLAIILTTSLFFSRNTYLSQDSKAKSAITTYSATKIPIIDQCNKICNSSEQKLFASSCSLGLTCVYQESGSARCRAPKCPESETCNCNLALRSTLTPAPSNTPIPCALSQNVILKKEIPGSIADFTNVNSNNTDWFITNDISDQKLYFKNGKISTLVNNFSLPSAPNPPPNPKKTYYDGDSACIKLHYDESLFDIASTLPGVGKLAGKAEICGVPLRCGNFEYGWVMRAKSPPKEQKIAFVGDLGLPYPGTNGNLDFADPEKVLQLIISEQSNLAVFLGDLDYSNSPERFKTLLDQNLPAEFPILTIAGNHDKEEGNTYQKYEELFAKIYSRHKDIYCENIVTPLSKNICYYKNISLTSIYSHGSVNPDEQRQNQNYISQSLSSSHTPWNFCGWHRTDTSMQLGGKVENFVGLATYASCAKFGAMIVSAHEHSYARSKSIVFHERFGQTDFHAVNNCPGKDAGNVCLSNGQSFVVVSGLGGHAQRRKQERCGNNNVLSNSNCDGKVAKDIWGAVYASSTKRSISGAYFVQIPKEGTQAKAYFKTVDGQIRDQFVINKVSQEPVANFQVAPSSTTTTSASFSTKFSFKNNSPKQIIQSVTIRICDKEYQNCQNKSYPLNLQLNESKILDLNFSLQSQQSKFSCTLSFSTGTTQTCGDYLVNDLNGKTANFTLSDHENILNIEFQSP